MSSTISSPSAASVPSGNEAWLGFATDRNSRDRMEDFVVVRMLTGGGAIFAVLDGHNGRAAVEFVASHLVDNVISANAFLKGNVKQGLMEGFAKTENMLKDFLEEVSSSGSCAKRCASPDVAGFPQLTSGVVVCVAVIQNGLVYTAHVGDARAVLCRGADAIQLTTDHNVLNPEEKKRVCGMICPDGYVNGLMVTRSLGNFLLHHSLEKAQGQSATPSCSETSLKFDQDEFLLIASDGLYDVISNNVAVETINRARRRPSFSPTRIAQDLVAKAVARGSCDNICVCIVMLKSSPQAVIQLGLESEETLRRVNSVG